MKAKTFAAALLSVFCAFASAAAADSDPIKSAVDAVVKPLMQRDHIPGLAVGMVLGGRTSFFDYGVASLANGKPVTDDTLFELGSISKTFTATLVSYAALQGRLSLSDRVAKGLLALKEKPFGAVTLLELGTHTPGGLPLQVPDTIKNEGQLMQYFAAWRPSCAPGSCRTYSNVGIGTLGLIAAKSMNKDFDTLMEKRLLPGLGLNRTYIHVPAGELPLYAEGYAGRSSPVRITMGVLTDEAAGLKSSITDMLRYVQINMAMLPVDDTCARAVRNTHTGYFRAGVMTQDLMWEQYAWPVTLPVLLDGNSPEMLLGVTPATSIEPPEPPRGDVWINKTGSTSGFGAYVAFIPEHRLGIVILGNRNYPIPDRVTAAYRIVSTILGEQGNAAPNSRH